MRKRPWLSHLLLAGFLIWLLGTILPPSTVSTVSMTSFARRWPAGLSRLVPRVRTAAAQAPLQAPPDERFFAQTGFSIADDSFWQYFQARGGAATFGYPTSRPFLFLGTRVQFFQRHVMQALPNGSVGLLNLLDPDLLPYGVFGDATVPAFDPLLAAVAPRPGTPDYGVAVTAFMLANVPNQWQGRPVGFFDAYMAPARTSGAINPTTEALIGLELLGFPTSRPAPDPNNGNFVYQRFQRGVLHYNATTGLTQPMLLVDYLKGLLRGRDVPPELLAQGLNSRFAFQYMPGAVLWLSRPADLPGTDLTAAFEREDQPFPAIPEAPAVAAPPAAAAQTATPSPALRPTDTPFPTATPLSLQPSPTVPPTVNPQPPVLDSSEPGGAAIGQDIVLRGRNFGTQPGTLFFTGKLTTAQVWSDTNIVVTVPQGAVDGIVRVRRADGQFSNAIGFSPIMTPTATVSFTATAEATSTTALPATNTLTPSSTPTPSPPAIARLNPYFAPANGSVIITGTNFGSSTGQVLMGNSFAPVEANGWSDVSIAMRVPSDLSPGTVRVFVRRPDGALNASPACFLVQAVAVTATPGGSTPTPAPTPLPPSSC